MITDKGILVVWIALILRHSPEPDTISMFAIEGHETSENTNVLSSPPDIKVSPSLVQLRAFTHLAAKGFKTEVRQLSFPREVWGGRGISVVSCGDLPGMAF